MFPYLIIFAHFHMAFRLPELDSLAVLEEVNLVYDKNAYSDDHPFFIVQLPSDEDARKLARRSILIKDVIRLYADEPTLERVLETARNTPDLIGPYANSTFRFDCRAFGSTVEHADQVARIEQFAFLPAGAVRLKNPDVIFFYMEDYGTLHTRGREPPAEPLRCMFGVWVASGDRQLVNKYDLKKRGYLGTTSMDAELSLVMANQALVRAGSFVLDPFVGTGSFLITCAHYGAFTMGADIDGRQIRGKGGKSIDSNAVQYNLTGRVLDTVVCDIAHHPWRKGEFWDAIVCDPPYGVRAGARKLGKGPKSKVPPGPLAPIKPNGEQRYPQTVPYELDDVLVDLIAFAAEKLVPGGRLVYWLPTVTDEYTHADVPMHPRFRLVANSNQVFGTWCRRLITMEKLREGEQAEEVGTAKGDGAPQAPAHAKFREVYFAPGRGSQPSTPPSERA